jgi:predicted phosphodiesterase
MRFGVIADVHGNLQALEAVVRELERREVEAWIVAGDLVGYGANPNECIEIVAGLDATCVAGNHDLIALGRLSDDRCIELARTSLRWTRGVLGDDARSFLAGLPLAASAPGGVVVAHGSLNDPQQYTRTVEDARAQLEELTAWRHAGVLVLGHTHMPLAVGASDRRRPHGRVQLPVGAPVVLNPGAAGQSREALPRARTMVLDLAAHEATFLRLSYDVAGCRAQLRGAGLSPRSCHLPPSPARRAGRVARAAVRRARPAGRRAAP